VCRQLRRISNKGISDTCAEELTQDYLRGASKYNEELSVIRVISQILLVYTLDEIRNDYATLLISWNASALSFKSLINFYFFFTYFGPYLLLYIFSYRNHSNIKKFSSFRTCAERLLDF